MISILSPSSEAFLANMARVQRTIDEASRQTSSGKRVNVASDAPGELDTILQLHTDETRNTQIQENLAVAKADADAADGALTSATQLMDRARVLAAQGATFTVDAAGRQSIFQRQTRERCVGRSGRARYDPPTAHRRDPQHADPGESRGGQSRRRRRRWSPYFRHPAYGPRK